MRYTHGIHFKKNNQPTKERNKQTNKNCLSKQTEETRDKEKKNQAGIKARNRNTLLLWNGYKIPEVT